MVSDRAVKLAVEFIVRIQQIKGDTPHTEMCIRDSCTSTNIFPILWSKLHCSSERTHCLFFFSPPSLPHCPNSCLLYTSRLTVGFAQQLQVAIQAAVIFGNGHLVVVHNHDEVRSQFDCIVQPLSLIHIWQKISRNKISRRSEENSIPVAYEDYIISLHSFVI